MGHSKMKGVSAAILSCMFFSISPIFEKTLLTCMSPLALAALRSLTGGVLLLFAMEVVHKMREIEELTRHDILMILLIIGTAGVLAPIFYLRGLNLTSVANTLLIGRSNSLLIAVWAWLFLKEKWTIHQAVGSVLMITGLFAIFTRGFTASYTFLPGDMYLLAAATMWSSSAVLMKRYLHHLPPEVIVVSRNMIGGLVLLVFGFGDVNAIQYSIQIPVYLIGLAVFGVILPQMLWYFALEHTKATTVGLASISIPIFGTFFAAIFLGEKLVEYQLIGGFLVLIGLTAMEIHLSQLSIKNLKRRLKLRPHFHH
ncbi:MAG: DMT family transporter [Candidatus Altiarchaeota archaeon]